MVGLYRSTRLLYIALSLATVRLFSFLHVRLSRPPARPPAAALEIGVALSLSTAQPTFHGNPPSLQAKTVSYKSASAPCGVFQVNFTGSHPVLTLW